MSYDQRTDNFRARVIAHISLLRPAFAFIDSARIFDHAPRHLRDNWSQVEPAGIAAQIINDYTHQRMG